MQIIILCSALRYEITLYRAVHQSHIGQTVRTGWIISFPSVFRRRHLIEGTDEAMVPGRGSVTCLYHRSLDLRFSLLQTTLVHVIPDVVHPPHSWSSFCPLPSSSSTSLCFPSSVLSMCPCLGYLVFNRIFPLPILLMLSLSLPPSPSPSLSLSPSLPP